MKNTFKTLGLALGLIAATTASTQAATLTYTLNTATRTITTSGSVNLEATATDWNLTVGTVSTFIGGVAGLNTIETLTPTPIAAAAFDPILFGGSSFFYQRAGQTVGQTYTLAGTNTAVDLSASTYDSFFATPPTATIATNGVTVNPADSFVVNVIPEPTSSALLGLGALGLLARRKRG